MDDLLTRPKRYHRQAELGRASTYYDPETVYTRLFSVTAADADTHDQINNHEWLDPLDPRVQRALDQTRSIAPHAYMGEPITTVAHQYYTRTTPWWLIVLFNGYLHPDEIPSGVELEIPDLEGFMEAYRAQARQAQRTIVF